MTQWFYSLVVVYATFGSKGVGSVPGGQGRKLERLKNDAEETKTKKKTTKIKIENNTILHYVLFVRNCKN